MKKAKSKNQNKSKEYSVTADQIDLKYPIQLRTSAGGIIFRDIDSKTEVLLVRINKNGEIKTEFPGGGIEQVEFLQDTVIRELKEETGYQVELTHFLDSVEHQYFFTETKQYYWGRTYWFIGKLKNMKKGSYFTDEIHEVLWMNIDEVEDSLTHEDQKQMFKKAKNILTK